MNDGNSQLPVITWFSLFLQILKWKISKTNDKVNIPLNWKVVNLLVKIYPAFCLIKNVSLLIHLTILVLSSALVDDQWHHLVS